VGPLAAPFISESPGPIRVLLASDHLQVGFAVGGPGSIGYRLPADLAALATHPPPPPISFVPVMVCRTIATAARAVRVGDRGVRIRGNLQRQPSVPERLRPHKFQREALPSAQPPAT
jgi:hypothetical protein